MHVYSQEQYVYIPDNTYLFYEQYMYTALAGVSTAV